MHFRSPLRCEKSQNSVDTAYTLSDDIERNGLCSVPAPPIQSLRVAVGGVFSFALQRPALWPTIRRSAAPGAEDIRGTDSEEASGRMSTEDQRAPLVHRLLAAFVGGVCLR